MSFPTVGETIGLPPNELARTLYRQKVENVSRFQFNSSVLFACERADGGLIHPNQTFGFGFCPTRTAHKPSSLRELDEMLRISVGHCRGPLVNHPAKGEGTSSYSPLDSLCYKVCTTMKRI